MKLSVEAKLYNVGNKIPEETLALNSRTTNVPTREPIAIDY